MVRPEDGRIDTAWYRFFLALWNNILGPGTPGVAVVGDMKAVASNSVPDGWLLCNGVAVSRSTYSGLFGKIGVTWGVGDGVTTFNLPDLQGKMPIGAGGAFVLGSSGGGATSTIGVANLPVHTHPITDPGHNHAITDPGHVHTVPTGTVAGSPAVAANVNASGTINGGSAVSNVTVNSNTTGINQTDSTGSGTPLSTISPYAVVNWCIKT